MSNSFAQYERFQKTQITIEDLNDIQFHISRECRWYLLGKLSHDEGIRNPELTRADVFKKLRLVFGLTDSTYRRLMVYRHSIDRLQELVPELMPRIIDGDTRLSIDNAATASRWEADDIREALEKLRDRSVFINTVFSEHPSHRPHNRRQKYNEGKEHRQSIKDTPMFDPEAQISGISCTIPSWVAAIDRAFTATEFSDVSLHARYRFTKELAALKDTAQIVLDMIKECR